MNNETYFEGFITWFNLSSKSFLSDITRIEISTLEKKYPLKILS